MQESKMLPSMRLRAADVALALLRIELQSRLKKPTAFNSIHEGAAYLNRHMTSMWNHVFQDASILSAIDSFDIANSAVRFVTDLCPSHLFAQPIAAGQWRNVDIADIGADGPWLACCEESGAIVFCDALGSSGSGISGYVNAPELKNPAREVIANVMFVAPVNRPGLVKFGD